jgi:S1-C subfamily serine protease
VKGGVIVKSFEDNSAFARTRMQEGFVILKVDGTPVYSVDDFRKAIEGTSKNSVNLEGVYPGYNEGVFVVPLKLSDFK